MLKALLKKQFMEMNAFYFMDRKTGKRRQKGALAGYLILYVFVFLILAGAFFAFGSLMAEGLIAKELNWLYFALSGIASIVMGAFGSVFNTYAALYHAKDNEMLLSMPIPPRTILTARLTGVYGMSLLYSAIAWIPACAAYYLYAPVTAAAVICQLVLVFAISGFVTVLSCALGYVVARISAKLKNKSIVTVLLSLLFIGAYYYGYSRINELIASIVANAEGLSDTIRTKIYLFWQLGLAGAGNFGALAVFTLITLALLALCVFIMARSFIRIATENRGSSKTAYKSGKMKAVGTDAALVRKELKRFLASPTYMLNAGIGLVIMPVAAAYLLIKSASLRPLIELAKTDLPEIAALIPAALTVILSMLLATCVVSAPSVSLEGKSIWILQSLPVPGRTVLRAKRRLHEILCGAALLITLVLVTIAMRLPAVDVLIMTAAVFGIMVLCAAGGLALNLKKPNLTWTNETVPVKQGASVSIMIFGGWVLGILIGVGAYFSRKIIAPRLYLIAVAAFVWVASILLIRWQDTKGAKIFETL